MRTCPAERDSHIHRDLSFHSSHDLISPGKPEIHSSVDKCADTVSVVFTGIELGLHRKYALVDSGKVGRGGQGKISPKVDGRYAKSLLNN